LAGVRILSQEIVKQRQAVQSAETQLKLELGRYETGIDPYLNVVIAQTNLLTNQQTLTAAQVSEMTSAVQLILALGGGWNRSQLPTPEQVTQKPTRADTTMEH
jgi:outer membrane protein TolC